MKNSYFFCAFILVLFLIAPSISSYAQAPGYEGKHLYVDFQFGPRVNLFPDQTNVTFYDKDGESFQPLYLTYQYGFGLNYVVSKGGIIGVDFTTRPNMYYRQLLTNTFAPELIRPKGYAIGLGYKFMSFRKNGYIAPVGKYWEVKPFVLITGFDAIGRFNSGYSAYEEAKAYPEYDRMDFGLSVGYGFQTVWWDQVIANYYVGALIVPAADPVFDNLALSAYSALLGENRYSFEFKVTFGILAL